MTADSEPDFEVAANDMPRRSSLVVETARLLREQLREGRWQEYLPGERVLCDLWQVSRPTLRAALQKLHEEGLIAIAHGCRTRVLAPASKRQVAKALTVCLLSPDPLELMPPFAMLWVDELRRQLAAAGHLLHIQVGKAGYANAQPEHALNALLESNPSAIWVLYQSTEAMQRWFAARKVCCVVVGSVFPGIVLPALDKDYRATCRHAVGLFASRGHRSVAMLIQKERLGGDWESERGFEEGANAIASRGVKSMIAHHDGSSEQIERAVLRLLGMAQRPTALLVARSAHALTVLTVLLSQGVKVPGEMALLCRDEDAFLDHVRPRMARYTVSPKGFAKRLFRLVMQQTGEGNRRDGGEHVVPSFVARESL